MLPTPLFTVDMRCLCVFSGGLDSLLAVELMRSQGLEAQAIFFETPFFTSEKAKKTAFHAGIPLKVLDITERHLKMLRNPKYGYGSHMNPCIDCHALMFRVAGERLKEEDAGFVVSGEVLGQRPMSQTRKSLSLVAGESGLDGLLLRPLSAKKLPPTIPEQKGWVNRDMLMDFHGRSRKPQMALAERFQIDHYPSPGGGCLLTEEVFSRRLKDLLDHLLQVSIREIELLKVGRHFRASPSTKMVVGRDKTENEAIQSLSVEDDIVLSCEHLPGPTTLVLGEPSPQDLHLAATITAAYSDSQGESSIRVTVRGKGEVYALIVKAADKKEFLSYMI